MPKVTFFESGGVAHVLDATVGFTLMEVAVKNDVPGIDADCRGSCACATCHVHVAPQWQAVVGPPNEQEADILELADNVDSSSRLSCQIRITEALDGLEVRIS